MPEISALGGLINYGALGIILLLLVFNILIPKAWVDRLLKNKDDQLAEKDKMIATLMEYQGPVIKLIETLNHQAEQKDKP